MTRLKRAKIALSLLALVNVAAIAATWPRPPKATEWAVLLLCGCSVVLAYRGDPDLFHMEVGKGQAMRVILTPILAVAVLIVLAKTHAL